MTLRLQKRTGQLVQEWNGFEGVVPDIIRTADQYFVRAGISGKLALFVDGTVLAMDPQVQVGLDDRAGSGPQTAECDPKQATSEVR